MEDVGGDFGWVEPTPVMRCFADIGTYSQVVFGAYDSLPRPFTPALVADDDTRCWRPRHDETSEELGRAPWQKT